MSDLTNGFIDPENEPVAPEVKPQVQVVVLIDRSGSMRNKEEQVVSGFNSYIKKLKDDPNSEYFVTRLQFDDEFQADFIGVPLAEVEPMTQIDFVPRGMTALRDGIGYGVRTVEKIRKDGQGVLFVINTDGGENQSHEFSQSQITDMIKEREAKDWTFVYLDADPTTGKEQATLVAQSMGLSGGNAFKMAPSSNYGALYDNLAHATVSYSACRSATMKGGGQLGAMSNFCAAMEDHSLDTVSADAPKQTLTAGSGQPTADVLKALKVPTTSVFPPSVIKPDSKKLSDDGK